MRRRRFLSILASAGLAGLAPLGLRGSAAATGLEGWTGTALGADASITLAGFEASEAAALFRRCREEINRLEDMFSLHRPGSLISRLNKWGQVADHTGDFVSLVETAKTVSVLTAGAFDPTVQPLWRLYADHFARGGAPTGPPNTAVARARGLVDYTALAHTHRRVSFARPGMALTLNGIAQGYITDRVTALLKRAGADHVLVNMGEYAALGRRPSGEPWRIGIRDPRSPLGVCETVALSDAALATSGGYGTVFDPAGRFHHLFDPKTGESTNRYLSVSVRHPRATLADAFSTAFSAMKEATIRDVTSKVEGMRVFIVRRDGEVVKLGAS